MNSQPSITNQSPATDTKADRLYELHEKHDEAIRELYIACNSFSVCGSSDQATEVLSEILEHWIRTEYVQAVRNLTNSDGANEYPTNFLIVGFDVLRLVDAITKSIEAIDNINSEIRVAKKEVGND